MADDPLLGLTIGQYTIKSQLGRGGMAIVYRAEQPSMGREVAIKVIDPRIAQTELFVSRFEREVRLISRLQHPHILPVYDFGQEPTQKVVFLVMRLVEGGSLDARIRNGTLSLNAARTIFSQVAGALAFAHSEGIIHRDLKPNNVLLDRQGNPYLTDFGLARTITDHTNLTETGNILGTPAYMAPEQWRSEPLDPRTDIYALGIMLFEMLSGALPYQSDTPYQMMYKHLDMPVPSPRLTRPDLPDAIVPVLQKALAKRKEDRYSSATEFAAEVDNALSDSHGARDTAFPSTQSALPSAAGGATDIIQTPPSGPLAAPASTPPRPAALPPTAPGAQPPGTTQPTASAPRRLPTAAIIALVAVAAAFAGIVLVVGPLRPLLIGTPSATGPLPTPTSPYSVIAAAPTDAPTTAPVGIQATTAPIQATAIPAQPTSVPTTAIALNADTAATSTPIQIPATQKPPTAVPTAAAQPAPPQPTASGVAAAAVAPTVLPTVRPQPSNTPVPATSVPTNSPVPSTTPVPPTATTAPSRTPLPPTATAVPPSATTVPSNTPPPPTATAVPPSATTAPSSTPIPTATRRPSATPQPTSTAIPPTVTPTLAPPVEPNPTGADAEPTTPPESLATQRALGIAALPAGYDFLEFTNVRFSPALDPNGTTGARTMIVTVAYRTALQGALDIAVWAEGFKNDNCTPYGTGDYYGDTHTTIQGPGAGTVNVTVQLNLTAATPYFGVSADIEQKGALSAYLVAHHRCYPINKSLPTEPGLVIVPINQPAPYVFITDTANWTYDASAYYLPSIRFRVDQPGDYRLVVSWLLFPANSDCNSNGQVLRETVNVMPFTGPASTRAGVLGVPMPLSGAPKGVAHKFALRAVITTVAAPNVPVARDQGLCWELKPAS